MSVGEEDDMEKNQRTNKKIGAEGKIRYACENFLSL